MEKIKNLFKSHKKLSIFLVLIIIVLGIFGWRYFNSATATPTYETAKVTKGTLISSVDESGSVSVANRIAINTSASGIIASVLVKSGDKVTQGQTIATVSFDNTGQQRQAAAYANYLATENSLDSAKAQLNSLQVTLFQTNQTFVNGAGTPNPNTSDPKYIEENAAWLAARENYTNQQNVINADEASVNNAWLSYQNDSSNIVAPTSGVISDLTIAPGMQIDSNLTSSTTTKANQVASIKTAGNPIITVDLSEIDAVSVQPGQKATVTFDALPNQTFAGKIIGINTTGTVTSGVTTYPAIIILDLPNDKILPNMSATANIITSIKNNVLMAPTSAIQTLNGTSFVRVLNKGQITTLPVTTGLSSVTDTEITSGLSEGQTVVIGYVASGSNATTSPFNRSLFGGIKGGAARKIGGGGR